MGSPRWRAPEPREHGGLQRSELAALGLDPAEVIDFSVNVNPYGPCAAVVQALRAAPVERYPDPTAAAVRQAIAARAGVPAEGIVFGNGAADLLWTLVRVLLGSGGRALVVEPAFSEFRAAVESVGAELSAWRASVEDGLVVDLAAVARAAALARADLVYLCAPTTPAGAAVPLAGVAELARQRPEAVVLLDESFLSLSDQSAEAALPMPENVVRLRSMTKEHAIPGLRAGYLMAPVDLARAVERSRPAWSTSSLAQAAALAALESDAFVADSRERLRQDRAAMVKDLAALGLSPFPSVAPYLVFPAKDAAGLRCRLLQGRVLVRDCASFGLSGYLRVAVRPARERAILTAALEKELRGRLASLGRLRDDGLNRPV